LITVNRKNTEYIPVFKIVMKYLKEILVIVSYVFMLLSCYFLEWKPLGLFLSYLIEVVALIVLYSVIRLMDQSKRPQMYKKQPPLETILISCIPLILFQYFIIGWMASSINPEENFLKEKPWMSREVIYSVVFFIIIYIIKLRDISQKTEKVKILKNILLFKAVALTLVNVVVSVIVLGFKIHDLLLVVSLMAAFRIYLEWFASRQFSKIN